MVQGPFGRADRAAYLAARVRMDPPRTCTVWLRPSTCTKNNWPEEVMRQCLAQEPEAKSIFSSLHKKRQTLSLTDILVAWAGRTRSFDAIAVYLELLPNSHSIQTTTVRLLSSGAPTDAPGTDCHSV